MEYLNLARVLHILAVVIWIGGVSMVTTVIIPAIRKIKKGEDQIAIFEKVEARFSLQAKITTLMTAITGFYMLEVMNAWHRLLELQFWWIHAMILVWLLFTLVLFVLEPLFLHKLFRKYAEKDPDKTFRFMYRLHWVLLLLSFISIFGAVAGGHGWYFFQ